MARRPMQPASRTVDGGRPKPWAVLTVVRSESGSWEYEIRTSHKTGVTYCTCIGWQMRKRCKHLDAFNAAPSFEVGTAADAPAVDLPATFQHQLRIQRTITTAQVLRDAL